MACARPSTTTAPGTPPARSGLRPLGRRVAWSSRPVVATCLSVALGLVLLACLLPLAGCSGSAGASTGSTVRPAVITHGRLIPGVPATADLDGDGVPEEVLLSTKDGTLSITDGAVSYHSRARWRVVQAVLGDTDHNGQTEVVTLLDSQDGRHLGLFAYYGGQYRERLVTQPIRPAPVRIEVVDSSLLAAGAVTAAGLPLSGDLVVLIQKVGETDAALRRTLLSWNGFGFTRISAPAG